ncbi:MAG TPA: translation elongation factor Ts [Terriglobia bacterium]|nr:translation elongation factor Ts [Terriglobia bacterium]
MEISAQLVKDLREKTGAGMMDCKKALTESKGDMEDAIVYLRKKGLASAQKKAGRAAAEGMVGHYIHMGGKIGVLVEVNCETDFAARSDDFQTLVKDVAMHVAALNPRWVRRDEVTAEDLQKEKEIYKEQARASGKPENIVEKIAEGKLESFYKETCLYDQAFVKDPNVTVEQLITNLVGKIGENIRVRRFVRYQTGEGLEKRSTDLKGEVEGMLGGGQ